MSETKNAKSGIVWRFLERFGAQIVTLIVSIVLARVLDPEIYGTIALVTVITSILQVFVDSGLSTALIQKKDSDELDFSTVFFSNIFICVVLYLGLFLFAPVIASFYENNTLTPIIRVLGIVVLISGVKGVQQAYVSRHLLFKKFFFSTLAGTVGAAIIGIWMAYAGFGVWALVVQYIFNTAVDTLVLWVTVKWRPKFSFSFQRFKVLFSYGWKIFVASLFAVGTKEARQLIIGKKYSTEDLAYYNRGQQFPDQGTQAINSAIDSVLLPVMSNVQNDKEQVKALTRISIKRSSFFIWPIMAGLFACASPFISIVLTDKWLPCVPFLQIFCIVYAFYPIQTANLNAIKALGESKYILILQILKDAISLTITLIAMFFGVYWIAIGSLAACFAAQIINSWPNKRMLGYSYLQQLKDILPTAVLSVIMALSVWSVSLAGLSNWVTLLIQIPLGIFIYVSGAYLMRIDSLDYFSKVFRNFLFGRKRRM